MNLIVAMFKADTTFEWKSNLLQNNLGAFIQNFFSLSTINLVLCGCADLSREHILNKHERIGFRIYKSWWYCVTIEFISSIIFSLAQNIRTPCRLIGNEVKIDSRADENCWHCFVPSPTRRARFAPASRRHAPSPPQASSFIWYANELITNFETNI